MQFVFKIECQLTQFTVLEVARVLCISNFYQFCTCYFSKGRSLQISKASYFEHLTAFSIFARKPYFQTQFVLSITSLARNLHGVCLQNDKVQVFQELIYRKTEEASRKV